VLINEEGAGSRRRGRVRQGRPDPGRPGGEAPGGAEPREHGLLHQAFMGRRYDEVARSPARAVQDHQGAEPGGAVQAGEGVHPAAGLRDDPRKLKKAAETYLGEEVKQAVITFPPTSTTPSGRRPRTPGRSPASMCSGSSTSHGGGAGVRPRPEEERADAVFDFGGGTFDISILEVGDNVVEVKSTNGDTHLAGTTSTSG